MRTKIAPSHHAIATLLTDDIISEMPQYLMEDYGYTLEKALDVVYRSKTVELLQIEKGELYVQSPAYVYDMLLQELHLHPYRLRWSFCAISQNPTSNASFTKEIR